MINRPRVPGPGPWASGAGPRAGPVFYLAFEANASGPPLTRLGVRKRLSCNGLFYPWFSQAVTCFHGMSPVRFTFLAINGATVRDPGL